VKILIVTRYIPVCEMRFHAHFRFSFHALFFISYLATWLLVDIRQIQRLLLPRPTSRLKRPFSTSFSKVSHFALTNSVQNVTLKTIVH
jgi:hypothetical protein